MRVGLIRSDLSRIYLDDVENTSQRNFSSQPPGQSRYFEYPLNLQLTSVLNQFAFLSVLGSGAVFPLTLTGANNTLTVKTTAAAGVSVTVPTGAYATAAALAVAINAQLTNAGILAVSSSQGGQIQVDTIAPGSPYVPSYAAVYAGVPQPPIGGSVAEYPFVNPINSGPTAILQVTGTLATALGIAGTLFTGLPVANGAASSASLKGEAVLNHGVYQYTAIAGQTGAAAAVASVGTNGTAVITGLTGMTANSTLHYLVLSGGSHAANDGTWQIVQYVSPTSVVIANSAAVVDTALTWTEETVTFNISYTQIGALSTFATMEGYSATTPTGSFLALATAIQNAIAPQLIETGPVLLSFAKGKLSILSAAYFQPGYPPQSNTASPFGYDESAVQRLGYAQGPAVYITANDGVTPFAL
jgi:hypothetical protein